MSDEQRLRAWAYLSRVAEAPCAELADLVARVGPLEAAVRVRRGEVDAALRRRTEARHEIDCSAADLELLRGRGGRLVTPDDDEWPVLSFLSFAGAPVRDKPEGRAPLALWAIGPLRLDEVTERAVAIVGTRSATAYGEHVAADLSAGLCEEDVVVVSGGAYGIDGAAHRAALAAEGFTVAVLAGGVDILYPAGHSGGCAVRSHRRGRGGYPQRCGQHRGMGAGARAGGVRGPGAGDIDGVDRLSRAVASGGRTGHPRRGRARDHRARR
jgi:DNA processing protein